MSLKSAMSSFGEATADFATSVFVSANNTPIEARIAEIDREIDELKAERKLLKSRLIEDN